MRIEQYQAHRLIYMKIYFEFDMYILPLRLRFQNRAVMKAEVERAGLGIMLTQGQVGPHGESQGGDFQDILNRSAAIQSPPGSNKPSNNEPLFRPVRISGARKTLVIKC